MRLRRTRTALGPLEPVLHDAWLRAVARWSWARRRALLVVAVDDDHVDRAEPLVAEADGRIAVWVTCTDDVAPLGSLGWFVVRVEPSAPVDLDNEVDQVLASWRRACRVVDVVDLRAGEVVDLRAGRPA